MPSAAGGTLLAFWRRSSSSPSSDDFLDAAGFVFDTRIASFVIPICGVTTMLLSLAPLFFARRVDLNLMLGRGGRTADGRRRRFASEALSWPSSR